MAGRRRAWHVYLLRCRGGSLYAGATNDLAARLARHAAGLGARYTRSRLPVELVWSVRVRDRSAALRRELAVKRLTRAEKLALAGVRDSDRGGRGERKPRARAPARPRAPG
jgi:putative endonuclease